MNLFDLVKHIDARLQKTKEGQKQNKRDRLEKIFFPIYQDVLKVHDYYLELFKSIRADLPTTTLEDNKMASIIHNVSQKFEVGGELYVKILENLKFRLKSEEKGSNDRFRDQVKAHTFSWLVKAEGIEEKRFIFSLIKYFLEQKGHYMDTDPLIIREATKLEQFFQFKNMNNFDESQINDFLNKYFDTPKSLIYNTIIEMNDAEEIRKTIIEKENELGWYMKQVSISYTQLQASTYDT